MDSSGKSNQKLLLYLNTGSSGGSSRPNPNYPEPHFEGGTFEQENPNCFSEVQTPPNQIKKSTKNRLVFVDQLDEDSGQKQKLVINH